MKKKAWDRRQEKDENWPIWEKWGHTVGLAFTFPPGEEGLIIKGTALSLSMLSCSNSETSLRHTITLISLWKKNTKKHRSSKKGCIAGSLVHFPSLSLISWIYGKSNFVTEASVLNYISSTVSKVLQHTHWWGSMHPHTHTHTQNHQNMPLLRSQPEKWK